jgi:hypothetical protein
MAVASPQGTTAVIFCEDYLPGETQGFFEIRLGFDAPPFRRFVIRCQSVELFGPCDPREPRIFFPYQDSFWQLATHSNRPTYKFKAL